MVGTWYGAARQTGVRHGLLLSANERLGDVPHLPALKLGAASLCSVSASAGSRPALAPMICSSHPRLPHHRFLEAVLKTDLFPHRSRRR